MGNSFNLNKIPEHLKDIGIELTMSLRTEIVMSLILIVAAVFLACNMNKISEEKETTSKKREVGKYSEYCIVVDPGHGGNDPGKIGVNNLLEKDVNLLISLKIEELLRDSGAEVILTRECDTALYNVGDRNKKKADMQKRCEIINNCYTKNSKTVVVSVHQNSYQTEGVKGAQVFYYGKSLEGKTFAQILQNKFNEEINVDRGKNIKENNNYYMLLHTKCPTIIAECGFLSNWEDAKNLADESYCKRIAEMISRSILEYIGSM